VRARRAAMCCSSQVREPTVGNEPQNLDRIGSGVGGLALRACARRRVCGEPALEWLWRTWRRRTGDRRIDAAQRASRRRGSIRVKRRGRRPHRLLRSCERRCRRRQRQTDRGDIGIRRALQALSPSHKDRRKRLAGPSKGLRIPEHPRFCAWRLLRYRAVERRPARLDRNRRNYRADRRCNRAAFPATAIVVSDR
jgi:hypothetical protein